MNNNETKRVALLSCFTGLDTLMIAHTQTEINIEYVKQCKGTVWANKAYVLKCDRLIGFRSMKLLHFMHLFLRPAESIPFNLCCYSVLHIEIKY